MDAIERSGVLKHDRAREEKQLREILQLLALEECKSPGLFIEDIINIKNKLQVKDSKQYKGTIIQARAAKFLAGEMPTKTSVSDGKEARPCQRNR